MSEDFEERLDDLVKSLRAMLKEAPYRGKGPMYHLFGIMYAAELEGIPMYGLHYIANRAGSPGHTMGTEILKGIRLAKYVDVKSEFRRIE